MNRKVRIVRENTWNADVEIGKVYPIQWDMTPDEYRGFNPPEPGFYVGDPYKSANCGWFIPSSCCEEVFEDKPESTVSSPVRENPDLRVTASVDSDQSIDRLLRLKQGGFTANEIVMLRKEGLF